MDTGQGHSGGAGIPGGVIIAIVVVVVLFGAGVSLVGGVGALGAAVIGRRGSPPAKSLTPPGPPHACTVTAGLTVRQQVTLSQQHQLHESVQASPIDRIGSRPSIRSLRSAGPSGSAFSPRTSQVPGAVVVCVGKVVTSFVVVVLSRAGWRGRPRFSRRLFGTAGLFLAFQQQD